MKLSTNIDQYTKKRKEKRRKQKQTYNEKKKNSKTENKSTSEKSDSKWAVYKRIQRERKKIETTGSPTSDKSNTKWASYKRKQRNEQKMKRLKDKERQRKHRQQKLTTVNTTSLNTWNSDPIYKNRMEKCRFLKKLKEVLPSSPKKRAAIMSDLIKQETPKTRSTITKLAPNSVEETVICNIKEFVKDTKLKRSNEARRALATVTASISNENLQQDVKTSLAKKLGLKPSRLSGGQRIRTKILKSEESCFDFINRRKRKDALSEETKKLIYNFWLSPEISRLTGNKKDVKRVRTGPKLYASHSIQILEKTQTEAYLAFKEKYPDIKISQRSFESLKPFFVIPVRQKDRMTCCCRICVETKMLFKRCMDFRRRLFKTQNLSENDKSATPVYNHLQDVVNETLCSKDPNKSLFKISCLNRECSDCGPKLLNLLPHEESSNDELSVHWERYEYVTLKVKGGKTRRKLQLIKKKTSPHEMYEYFFELLKVYPSHQFRAVWQNKQYRNIVSNLPTESAVVVHDFSENYRCSERTELQSSYFQRSEVSIHVSIIHRHAVLEYDFIPESETVTEQFFVISDDLQHDRFYVTEVQKQISAYLQSIPIKIENMVEFTDGCSCQYKSRNCMGDISTACGTLNYSKISRNFYETSHAKGPQDAAGGFLKKQADLAVLRGKCEIQSAKDFFQFANTNLTEPKSGIYKRRIFRYIGNINRDERANEYKPVRDNRKIHHISSLSISPKRLSVANLSCYECNKCLFDDNAKCKNSEYCQGRKVLQMECMNRKECDPDENFMYENENISDLVTVGSIVAVLADDDDYEYYLIKVSKVPFQLEQVEHDDWGNVFPIGSKVIKGLYYNRKKQSPLKYELVRRKVAIVYSVAIRYITDIEPRDSISISECEHLDILESMES